MTHLLRPKKASSSFRDPSGCIFTYNGLLYRQINKTYQEHYDFLISSGCYNDLVSNNLLVRHQEVNDISPVSDDYYKIIKPEKIPFITYPYEWSFSQLKDAAITTIEIQKKALDYGLILKDSSAYNIQFKDGNPILIDTLSFEKYSDGQLWTGYRQFCQHFLAPLALMSYKDIRLCKLLQSFLDGIPLDLTSSLLPMRTYLNFSLLSHIHLHAKSQKHFSGKKTSIARQGIRRHQLFALISNLESSIKKLNWQPRNTEWASYYHDIKYSPDSLADKKQIISQLLDRIRARTICDLGSNTGMFSGLPQNKNILTISIDNDPAAIEINYLKCRKGNKSNVLPLYIDITNPSPGIGWAHQERMSLLHRGPFDICLALALIHHLVISDNLPFPVIADYLSKLCHNLIIEFIPKDDPQVQLLLATRKDIFSNYTKNSLENSFRKYFKIENAYPIKDSRRIIYLMTKT